MSPGRAQSGVSDAPAKEMPSGEKADAADHDQLGTQLNLVREALQAGDLAGARKTLDNALLLAPTDVRVMNIQAAVLTYERNFDEARKVFLKLLGEKPDDFSLNWNLAEVDFLQGNYFSARQRLLKLRESRPKDEMLCYKILLTHLLEGRAHLAKEELEKIPFPSDTAAYYYGRAALAFQEAKNLSTLGEKEASAKSRQEGLDWLAEAGRIFRLQHNLLFADSLIEKKFITREEVTGLVPLPGSGGETD